MIDNQTKSTRALRVEEVLEKVGVGRTMLYALVKEGDFPRPIKYGRASRWLDQEVDAWLKKKAEERDQGARDTP